MTKRLLPLALILFAFTAAAANDPSAKGTREGTSPTPWKLAPANPAKPSRKPRATHTESGTPIRAYINGVPDTGQFLPDTAWLVRVDGRVTRASDFVERWFGGDPNYRPAPDSAGRVRFLNMLIDRDVLGLSAVATNRPMDFTDRAAMREFEQRVLSDILFQRYVWDSVRVSDAEADSAARQIGMEGHFRHILFAERAPAEKVRAALVSGKLKWEEAARKYTIARDDKGPGGDRGWVGWANFPVGLAAPLFKLQPGQISEVLRTGSGYEVIQLLEKRQRTGGTFTAFRNVVQKQLAEERASSYAEAVQSMIRTRIGMQFDTVNVRYAAAHFQPTSSIDTQNGRPTLMFDESLPAFSADDTARVLCRWNGGQYTIGAFVAWYSGIPAMVRPSVNFPDGLMAQLENVLYEPYRAQIARDRGLDTLAIYHRRMADKREQIMVDHMYQDSVASKVWVSRDERLAYYKQHLPEFMSSPSADFVAILRHNKTGADSVAKALVSGANPAEILRADSLQGDVTGGYQHRRFDEPGPYHKVLFEELRPGGVSVMGPDRGGDYAVLQLLAYDAGRQRAFEEVQAETDAAVQAQKSEARLQAMLANLRPRFHIASRPELVMKILLTRPR